MEPDDTVALSRQAAVALLESHGHSTEHTCAKAELRRALDHPVEREEEFVVVGGPGNPDTVLVGPFAPRLAAERARDRFNLIWRNVRIQSRVVTRTEWRDVEEADHDQA